MVELGKGVLFLKEGLVLEYNSCMIEILYFISHGSPTKGAVKNRHNILLEPSGVPNIAPISTHPILLGKKEEV